MANMIVAMTSLSQYRVFYREFRRHFHDTVAVLPSSRFLAKELARFVSFAESQPATSPRHLLEVGSGTGVVTEWIVRRLCPDDRLDLVELNGLFLELLENRFRLEDKLSPVAERVRILHRTMETLTATNQYDVIVSGLPLNNFTAEHAEQVRCQFERLLKPCGHLSFFEYIAIRTLRSRFSNEQERAQLRAIGSAIRQFLQRGKIWRKAVWLNVPPALVNYVQSSAACPTMKFAHS